MTGVSWRSGCPVGFATCGWSRPVMSDSTAGCTPDASSSTATLPRTWRAPCAGSMGRASRSGGWSRSTPTAAATSLDRGRQHLGVQLPARRGVDALVEHAYGRAIDVNPIENPYVSGGDLARASSAVPRPRALPPGHGRPGERARPGVRRRSAGAGAATGRRSGLPALLRQRPLGSSRVIYHRTLV